MSKKPDEHVRRRLYTLYPEQIVKLAELSKVAGISQSQYLRELIECAYASKVSAQVIKKSAG